MSNRYFGGVVFRSVLALTLLAGCDKGSNVTPGSATGSDATTKSYTYSSGASGSASKSAAFITNGIDPFWDTAVAGAKVGGKEFGLAVEIQKPAKGVQDQNRILEGLTARGIDGIAISPIDAAGQINVLNDAAEHCKLITQDSDAPQTNRLCFIGVNNYRAGRQVGQMVKEALPNGGKVMIFVGRLEQSNAQQRRQGVIDELLDRPVAEDLSKLKFDPQSGELKGAKYSVLDTRTDGFDYGRAKSNCEDAITAIADLGCVVGLFAYNPPQCLAAVQAAGKVGKIQIVGFDEQDDTLRGIKEGSIYGTISQQPFRYGELSMKVLAGAIKGDMSLIPANKYIELQGVVVKKDNVDSFWKDLKAQQAQGKAQ